MVSDEMKLGQDDGFVTVHIGPTQVRIDAIEVWEKYQDWRAQHSEDESWTDRLPAFLQEVGLPPCSRRMAYRFLNRLVEIVSFFGKADAPTAEPPGSTASGPEDPS